MRQLQAIVTNPITSTTVKLRAAKADFHLNIVLLKLEYVMPFTLFPLDHVCPCSACVDDEVFQSQQVNEK
jgi:hypothetical protein